MVGIFVQKPAGRRSPEARSRIWGRVEAPDGRTAWARMETEEGYRFTAMASVRGVERILEGVEPGVLTPTQAFGAPFAEEIPGTEVMGPFPGEPEPGA